MGSWQWHVSTLNDKLSKIIEDASKQEDVTPKQLEHFLNYYRKPAKYLIPEIADERDDIDYKETIKQMDKIIAKVPSKMQKFFEENPRSPAHEKKYREFLYHLIKVIQHDLKKEEAAAAVKLQSIARGRSVRKKKKGVDPEETPKSSPEVNFKDKSTKKRSKVREKFMIELDNRDIYNPQARDEIFEEFLKYYEAEAFTSHGNAGSLEKWFHWDGDRCIKSYFVKNPHLKGGKKKRKKTKRKKSRKKRRKKKKKTRKKK
jgi:hypothetical protein